MSEAEIEIKLGQLSVKYSGSQEFIEHGLLNVINDLIEFSQNVPIIVNDEVTMESAPESKLTIEHRSTNTIAGDMGVKTGPDLIMAAIAHIQLVQGRDKASRGEISQQMKSATTYFKQTYQSNLSAYLDNLVRQRRINLISKDTYALTAGEQSSLMQFMR